MMTAGVAATMVASLGIAANAEEATYKVGVCQLIQHEALDAATQGFQDALTEKLGDRVTFDVQNASGESVNCSTIINGFVSRNELKSAHQPNYFVYGAVYDRYALSQRRINSIVSTAQRRVSV